ncbi:MAG: hypothetical protein E7505_05815 [Ruminococcus sp.]|nr:hypothetical protein [Ruminococcus sp.]
MKINSYEKEYKNYGRCICVETEYIKLIASLGFGPRILYFSLNGEENILFEDIDRDFTLDVEGYGTWYTYGGHRLWRAPEVVPETYYPDNGKVDVSLENNILKLTASPTPFGTQYSIFIEFNDDGSVSIENRILNCSDKPLRFAPWSITGLAPGGTEYISLNTEDTGYLPNRVIALWPYSKLDDARFTLTDDGAVLRQDPSVPEAFKVGFNVVSGSAKYIKGNQTYIKEFEAYDPEYRYPDFSCNFETYTNGKFIECEIVGNERDYMPGESAVINEKWRIVKTEVKHDR